MNLREKYIKAGVANLKEFGYPSVNAENILTDRLFKMFFRQMLNGNLGDPDYDDKVLQELIDEIEKRPV